MQHDPRAETDKGATVLVTVDDRERPAGLDRAVASRWPRVAVGRLSVGDVEVGAEVLVERKSVADFVASLADGRLYAQAYGLAGASRRPLLIVEGRDGVPFMNSDPRTLRGALLTLMTSYRVPLYRTADVLETADVLAHLAARESRRLARRRRRGAQEPRPPRGRVAAGLLGAIPGVGDIKASALLQEFGSARRVLAADTSELERVRGVGPATARAVRRADEDGLSR